MRTSTRRSALAVTLALAAAACGGSSDPSTSNEPATSEGAATDDGTTVTTEVESAATVVESDTSVVENVDTVVYGGDLIVGLEAEAAGLRPWEDPASSSARNIMHTLYDVLMTQTAEGGVEGYLAASLEPNEDFTIWTMTLRPGVTFSDTTPLTAQTIADMFPIQQTGTTAAPQVAASGLAEVEATGDLEVTYRLSSPNSAFPSALTEPTLGMVFEPGAAAADPEAFNEAPVGTGPYTLESRDLDNETVVVRRNDYWLETDDGNQLPYLDTVAFRPIADEGSRLDSLISGTTNAMMTLRAGTVRDARAESDLTLVEFQGNTAGAGMFNTLVPPLDDVRVRRGLNFMNDQERTVEAIGGAGISAPATQWFSPDDPFWTQEAADTYRSFDFAAGTALIQEYVDDPARSDGKTPGEKIDVELSCPPDPTLTAFVQVLEQVWTGSELVDVTLTSFDQATHISSAVNDEHVAHCWRYGGQGDPGSLLAPFVADYEVSIANFANYNSPTMQAAVAAANTTDDFDERKALFSEVMQEINNEALLWYVGHSAMMIATEDNVVGVNSWELPDGTLGIGIPNAVTIWSQVFLVD